MDRAAKNVVGHLRNSPEKYSEALHDIWKTLLFILGKPKETKYDPHASPSSPDDSYGRHVEIGHTYGLTLSDLTLSDFLN
jgi:hypothetical protein